MTSRLVLTTIGLAAAAALTLAGCGADTPAASSSPATASSPPAPAPAPASSSGAPAADTAAAGSSAAAPSGPAVLATASSDLGDIVVDGAGRTLYVFDKDTADSGTSACADQCAAAWPAFAAGSGTPTADGVTGKVGTIKGIDGSPQITLDGRPLYYFAKDAAAGDVTGQGVGGIWWVIGADGAKMTAAGSPAPSS